MERRRLLGEILLACPLIMLAAIAMQGRTSTATFEPYAYNREQHAAVLAYQPYVAEAKCAVRSDDPLRVRRAAERLIAAIDERKLAPLKRANYYDNSRTGIKSQISAAVDQLATDLCALATSAIQRGEPDQALADVRCALRLTGLMKSTDFSSMGYFAMRERLCMQTIWPAIDSLSLTSCESLTEALSQVDLSDDSFLRCSATADRYYAIDGLRWDEPRARVLDPFARKQSISNPSPMLASNLSINALSRPLFDEANCIRYANVSLQSEKKALRLLLAKISQRQKQLQRT